MERPSRGCRGISATRRVIRASGDAVGASVISQTGRFFAWEAGDFANILRDDFALIGDLFHHRPGSGISEVRSDCASVDGAFQPVLRR